MGKYTHITLEEREKIYLWFNQGKSLREIGKRLGRDHRSVGRELKRNAKYGQEYMPCKADKKAQKRALKQRYKAPLKKVGIFLYVREKLRLGWSPETIAGRLTVEYPDKSISVESIYSHIYHPKNKKHKLWQYLTNGRKKRMKKGGRSVRRDGKIPGAISIDLRPKEIEKREEVGHWETDLMEGPRSTKPALSVTVERASRYTRLSKVDNKKASSKTAALRVDLLNLPQELRQSLTADNGSENTDHKTITQELSMPVYFCHAYHSWEKGTVENTIGRIRRFIPKGSDLTPLTEEYLFSLEEKLNTTPRKCLGYLTPYEKITKTPPIPLGDYF